MTSLTDELINISATTNCLLLSMVSGLGLGATIHQVSRGDYYSALFCLGTSFVTGALTYNLQRKYEEENIFTEAYKIINQNPILEI